MGKDVSNASSQWSEKSMNMERIECEYEFRFIELLDVHQVIQAIDIHKASGVEGINAKVLKDCLDICEF